MVKNDDDKELFWLAETVTTPPLSSAARVEAGYLLRRLQKGEMLSLPHARPMPSIGKRCYELRITDENKIWRIMYRLDSDAIVIIAWFEKKTQATPRSIIELCIKRLKGYDAA